LLGTGCIRLMKGHEDDGNVLWKPRSTSPG